jgi:hypothetical protein
MAAEPDALRRLLASALVRIPFFTSRSTREGLIAEPGPAAVGAAAVAAAVAAVAVAVVAGAAVGLVESAANAVAAITRHAVATQNPAFDRKEFRIISPPKSWHISLSGGKA